MADEGTLATSGEVLLAIGKNASANQILEANTNIWIKFAEADISNILLFDVVSSYSNFTTLAKRFLAAISSHRAAWYAFQENQNTWSLPTTQSKLNVANNIWSDGKKDMADKDIRTFLGLA